MSMSSSLTSSSLTPSTDPSDWTMSLTEDLVLPFDATGDLVTGESVVSVTSKLYDIEKDATIILAHAPYPVGPDAKGHYFVNQRIVGPTDLPHVGNYRLTINFVASPSTSVWAMELTIIAVA